MSKIFYKIILKYFFYIFFKQNNPLLATLFLNFPVCYPAYFSSL
jgi:hypothetical protein